MKTDIGKVPNNASFFDNAKLGITILIAISLFFGIIINFLEILGTEKSQSLTYSYHSDLAYPLENLQTLYPFHQFTFFEKEDIEDRIACKEQNQMKECKKIEEKRCEYKGLNTTAYETCRIRIYNIMN